MNFSYAGRKILVNKQTSSKHTNSPDHELEIHRFLLNESPLWYGLQFHKSKYIWRVVRVTNVSGT